MWIAAGARDSGRIAWFLQILHNVVFSSNCCRLLLLLVGFNLFLRDGKGKDEGLVRTSDCSVCVILDKTQLPAGLA